MIPDARNPHRRDFLKRAAGVAAATLAARGATLPVPARAQESGERPPAPPPGFRPLNPRGRVPVSLIIDDSTCLVNLAHYAIPQFAEVFPDRYTQDWRALPREIPDAFVREFADWCRERGVKGKYSIVPFPACVGRLDRLLPGWSRKELENSLRLVRDEIVPDWDIHPEMVTHTWAIDVRAGHPYPERDENHQENWGFSAGKSADFLAEYLAYALRILKNVDLPCEGVTTPGGFGNRVLPELAEAVLSSCRDVYSAEIPHYFRHLYTDDRSVAPRVELASGLDTDDPRCVVSVIGCTGDWFGGWDGLEIGSVDRFITADLAGGRLPEVVARGEPAILVCHWPGIYCNGGREGFRIFQGVVDRLHARYDNLLWMKNSEIARHWAARELTAVARTEVGLSLRAPFANPEYTCSVEAANEAEAAAPPVLHDAEGRALPPFREVRKPLDLVPGAAVRHPGRDGWTLCFPLPKGASSLRWLRD